MLKVFTKLQINVPAEKPAPVHVSTLAPEQINSGEYVPQVVIVDESMHERMTNAHNACVAEYSFRSMDGWKFFLSGAGIGAIASNFVPRTSMYRTAPFFVLGLSGIVFDHLCIKNICTKKFPLPQHIPEELKVQKIEGFKPLQFTDNKDNNNPDNNTRDDNNNSNPSTSSSSKSSEATKKDK